MWENPRNLYDKSRVFSFLSCSVIKIHKICEKIQILWEFCIFSRISRLFILRFYLTFAIYLLYILLCISYTVTLPFVKQVFNGLSFGLFLCFATSCMYMFFIRLSLVLRCVMLCAIKKSQSFYRLAYFLLFKMVHRHRCHRLLLYHLLFFCFQQILHFWRLRM